MLPVEVFKTNITNEITAIRLVSELQQMFPLVTASFDLEDCDNILRLSGDRICPPDIVAFLTRRGFICEVLE
jgi:hypothetical protein